MTPGRVALVGLAGGRSLARQRHELRCAAARLNFSRRASAWIKEVLSTSLTLSADSGYGQCLTEVAAAFGATGGSRDEVRPGFRRIGEQRQEGPGVTKKASEDRCPPELAPRRSSPVVSQDQARHSLRPLPSGAGPITSWRDVCQGPLRAETKLLRRLIGKSEPSQTETSPRQLRFLVSDNTPDSKLPSLVRSSASEKKWREEIAERAAAVLCHDTNDPPTLPLREQDGGPESSSFEDQWSIDLHGQTAPADLLSRLTSVELPPSEELCRTRSSIQPGPAETQLVLEIPGAPRPADAAASSTAPGSNADRGRDGGGRSASELASLCAQNICFPDSVVPGAEVIPLASSLPPILVPRSARHPESSVPAAMVRQSVRAGEIYHQESPEALAERIRRILQEEARRHGIDV
jgi:hypothetical protein